MKKLLLLLIIPFLSFGQCEDPNACNFLLNDYYGIEGGGYVVNGVFDYVGDYYVPDNFNEYYCQYEGDFCATSLGYLFSEEYESYQYNSFYTWDENCECSPPPGCQDNTACNYGQGFDGWEGMGSYIAFNTSSLTDPVIVSEWNSGAYDSAPYCLLPGDSCNVFNESAVLPGPLGYSGVLNNDCACICTNSENIWTWEMDNFGFESQKVYDNCPEQGCTDVTACNYNVEATYDDNSCFYPDNCDSCDITSTCSCDELTYVPDDNLEAYIEQNIPGASNGIVNDDYVITDALLIDGNMFNYQINLTAAFLNGLIFDFTGIEAFQGDLSFNIDNQPATTIDLSCLKLGSEPTFLTTPNNITISNCPLLEEILLPHDTIASLVISDNTSLSSVIFHEETAIRSMVMISNCNNLCELNLKGKLVGQPWSSNGNPMTLVPQVSLYSNNSLAQVDLSELNEVVLGSGFTYVNTENSVQVNMNNEWLNYWGGLVMLGTQESVVNIYSPYGGCIDVSDPNWCELSNYWTNNEDMIYENGCYNPIDCDDNFHVTDYSLNRILVKTIDILGRETTNKGFQLHIYDDGSVEKKYIIK